MYIIGEGNIKKQSDIDGKKSGVVIAHWRGSIGATTQMRNLDNNEKKNSWIAGIVEQVNLAPRFSSSDCGERISEEPSP